MPEAKKRKVKIQINFIEVLDENLKTLDKILNDENFKVLENYFYFKHYTSLKNFYYINILKGKFYASNYAPNNIRTEFNSSENIKSVLKLN